MDKHQLNVAKKPKKKPEDHGDFLARKKELEGVFERGKAAAREDKLAIWSETVDWWQHGSPQPWGVFTGDQRATRRSRGTTTAKPKPKPKPEPKPEQTKRTQTKRTKRTVPTQRSTRATRATAQTDPEP